MMKQQVWIVNSSLILFFFLLFGIQTYTKRKMPVRRKKHSYMPSDELLKEPGIAVNLEKIYKNDLFGTYAPPSEKAAEKKNLVTPIPQLVIKKAPPPPEIKKPETLPPLTLSVKGIILSDDPDESIALIADQTNKESSYYVGSKIQDAQIIKMTQNKVVLLRANGQQETHYLRKPEKLTPTLENWDFAIKKIEEDLYHVDPEEFVKEVTSAGELVEALEIGTVYKQGQPLGMRVGDVDEHPIGKHLGFEVGDMITKINGIETLSPEKRKTIHYKIISLGLGDQIVVEIDRNGSKKTITYILKKLLQPTPFGTPVQENKNAQETEDELFKLGPNAKRRQKRRAFEHRHRTVEQQSSALSDMRSRLLNNMRDRAHNRRVW